MPLAPSAIDHDAALLACAAGDRQAFRRLYDAEVRQMIGVALRIVRQRQRAEDVVHDAFVAIWEKAASFDPARGSGRGWIYSVVRHRALNEARQAQHEMQADEDALQALQDRDATASTPTFGALPMDIGPLRDCLSQLEDDKQSSLLMAYVEGCTHAEIAQRLKTPLGTIKAWIRRGLQSLRECMA
jgi:RNA polymerase sigma factor (sigma-70 family)